MRAIGAELPMWNPGRTRGGIAGVRMAVVSIAVVLIAGGAIAALAGPAFAGGDEKSKAASGAAPSSGSDGKPRAGAPSAGGDAKPKAARATRADLDAARRRAARLESEVALASTRKPYLVLDLEENVLRYRLMGLTMHEVPLPKLRVEGLLPAHGGKVEAPALAGIVSLKEKEGDPRLTPLSPEQVEQGADDENAANALPPEVPKEYRLTFNQKIAVRVAGEEEATGIARIGAWVRAAAARFRGNGGDDSLLRIRLALDPAVATEVYRSLLPDQRWLVLPPRGYRLPAVGQEPPPKPKSPRPPPAVTARSSKKKDAEREIRFAIPPPVEPPGSEPTGFEPPPADDGGGAVPPEAHPGGGASPGGGGEASSGSGAAGPGGGGEASPGGGSAEPAPPPPEDVPTTPPIKPAERLPDTPPPKPPADDPPSGGGR